MNSTSFTLPAHPGGLPLALRGFLTVFVLVVGLGYAAAVTNVVGQNEMNDGQPGLTVRDLVARYHGVTVEVTADDPPPSKMLVMIDGKMNKNFESEADYRVVRSWITDGAKQSTLAEGSPSPASVLKRDCLLCHSDNSGEPIADDASFGPTDQEIDFARLAAFAKPPEPDVKTVTHGPVGWRALAMTSHAHLLAVPVFVGIVGVLFLWTGVLSSAPGLRLLLGAAPLACFGLEVSCWWLARIPSAGHGFALAVGLFGGLFGLTFLLQWLVVMVNLWRRPRAS